MVQKITKLMLPYITLLTGAAEKALSGRPDRQ